MDNEKKNTVYIGIIKNDSFTSKTLVAAENPTDAREKVLEKYKTGLGTYFHDDDISVLPFTDAYK